MPPLRGLKTVNRSKRSALRAQRALVRATCFSATPESGDARFEVRRLGAAFVERARSKAASSRRAPKRFAQARANDAMLQKRQIPELSNSASRPAKPGVYQTN